MHLIHTAAYGGIETSVINWLRRINRENFQAHLVCFANPGNGEAPFVEAAARHGLTVHKIPWRRSKPVWEASSSLLRLMHLYNVDILHTHNPYADLVGALAAARYPVKTITTVYVWDRFDWKRNILQFIDRCVIRHFDFVSAHCEATYRQTLTMGIPANRLRTLICGYDVPRIEMSAAERRQRRKAFGASDGDIVIGNVARLWPEKAQDLLLRCFSRLLKLHPAAKLWIAGVGPSEAYLKSYSASLGLTEHVRFVGFVDELATFLPLLDIQVDPAKAAGVSLAICSGMASGLPIIAADVGGLAEVLKQGETGILVPRDDEDAYLREMLALIEKPDERIRIGRAAASFIRNEYSLERAVARVEETYIEMAQAGWSLARNVKTVLRPMQ